MIEAESVAVVSDKGHKRRWGVGQFLYRQDGKKLTIQGKYVLIGMAMVFLTSTMLILIRGPTEMELRSPITFEGITANNTLIDVPGSALGSVFGRSSRAKGKGAEALRYGGLEVIKRNSALQIPPGTFGKAKLTSGASNGLVKAAFSEDLTFNGEVLVEVGTTLVGTGSSTEDRLLVDFTKMVFKDGTVQSVRAQACDTADQMVGLQGSKVSRYGAALGAGIGLNFAGGLAQGLQENSVTNGIAVKKTDLGNAALNGASTASIDESKALLEKWKTQKTIIQVPSGTDICVIFSGE